MKKFLSILVLFLAMFMFAACGEEEKEDNKTNEDDKQGEVEDEKDPGEGEKDPEEGNKEVDFTVPQDVNKEVKLTEAGKKGVADLLTAFGAEEANQMVEQVVPMVEMARLSDEQVVEIAAIVTENMAVIEKLMALMESSKDVAPDEDYYEKLPMSLEVLDAPQNEEEALPITAAEVKQLVKAVKDLLNAIGDDTIGLFLYNYIQTMGEAMPFEISLEAYVVESRMIMLMAKSIVGSISDADIDEVYTMMTGAQTDEAMARLVAIVKDTVNAINFDDSVWESYFAVINAEVKKLFESPEFLAMLEGMMNDTEASSVMGLIYSSAIGLYEQVSKLTPAMIQYVVNVLDEVDAEFIGISGKDYSTRHDYNWETNEEIVTYYINGKEVTKEEYEAAQSKLMKESINVFYNAYKKLSQKDKDAIVETVEVYLVLLDATMEEMFKQEMPGQNIDEFKYQGAKATLEEVFAELDKVLAKEVITEDDFMPLLEKAMGYAATKAPLFVGMMLGNM